MEPTLQLGARPCAVASDDTACVSRHVTRGIPRSFEAAAPRRWPKRCCASLSPHSESASRRSPVAVVTKG